jgi:hypothetical protein
LTFFYFRDPAYGHPRPELLDAAADGEVASSSVRASGAVGRERLAALKDRIRASGLAVREGYRDPDALGRAVLADLTATIERLFPVGSEPGPRVVGKSGGHSPTLVP